MEHSTAGPDQIQELPFRSIDEVRPGDLLFFARDGRFRRLVESVGDIWTHSAIAVADGETIRTAEAGTSAHVFSRELEAAVGAYTHAVVATPTALTDACIMDAANWARDQIDGAQIYAWDDLLFAAVFLLTRRSFPVTVIKDLGEALEEVAERHSELRAQTLTCSAFVHRAFQLGGDLCSLQVLLPQPPIDVAMIDGGEPARIDAFWDADEAMKAYYLETATLWSIIEAQEELDLLESMNGSRVSTSQLAAAAKIVFQVAKAYGQGAGDDDPSSLPGRWVSPTDLWRCPQLGDRALLVVDRS